MEPPFSLQCSLQYFPWGPPLETVHEQAGCAHFCVSTIANLLASNLRPNVTECKVLGCLNLTTQNLSTPFFPDSAQVNDHLDRFLHVLDRDPLEARMEVVLTGEQIGGRKVHEREA